MFQAVCVTCQIPSLSLFCDIRRLNGYFHVPILVPIQEGREYTVQVCACADKEEDDEEERLELEDAELDDNVVSVRRPRIFGRMPVVPL